MAGPAPLTADTSLAGVTGTAGEDPHYALWWRVGVAVLVLARVVGALTLMISDCDETFNYWEPTHFVRQIHLPCALPPSV